MLHFILDSALNLHPVLERFAAHTPIPVMARAVIERCLCPADLDAWFERTADTQYTRELLFSSVFALMTQVVLRESRSVHAAWRAAVAEIGVSVTSVYNKLNGLAPETSAALVRYAGAEAGALIDALDGAGAHGLPGYTVKVLDGNALAAREHRLAETRTRTSAPLPGKLLAVLEPARGLITDRVACADAYTQERALVGALLERIRAGELWIADRNFCTRGWLTELDAHGAAVLVREHANLRFTPLEPMRPCGRVATGTVAEQRVRLEADGDRPALELRRLGVRLDPPTRDGDDTLYLLCTLPPEAAELYRKRWTVEAAFLSLTKELRCEVDTLGYPGAALFGFACAVVAFNLLAVVKAALRAAHGAEVVDAQVSGYHLGGEFERVRAGLAVAVEPAEWQVFRTLSLAAMAVWLRETAAGADLRRYRKASRGPKQPPPKRINDPHQSHVATARLLAARKSRKSP